MKAESQVKETILEMRAGLASVPLRLVVAAVASLALFAAGCSTEPEEINGAEQILRDIRASEQQDRGSDTGQSADSPDSSSSMATGDADLESRQQAAFIELKKGQEPYSARQNRLVCSLMATDPSVARDAFSEDYGMTWEEFAEPLAASCWEWIEGMSDEEMQALVLFEQNIARDIFEICATYREVGTDLTRSALKEWLELSGEPASLAGELTKLVARECKKR